MILGEQLKIYKQNPVSQIKLTIGHRNIKQINKGGGGLKNPILKNKMHTISNTESSQTPRNSSSNSQCQKTHNKILHHTDISSMLCFVRAIYNHIITIYSSNILIFFFASHVVREDATLIEPSFFLYLCCAHIYVYICT